MKKILLTLFAMSMALLAHAQLAGGTIYRINGTDGGSGPTRTFATLRSAITYVNTNGLTGSGQAVLEFSTGYTSENMSSRITINALTGASATLGLTIRPATGMNVSLTGSNSLPLIELDNADYVTIDGRPGGAGTTGAFSLENTSQATSAQVGGIRLANDAQYNRFCYLTLKTAAGANLNSGAIMLHGTTGTLGNTDNIINNNTFTFASTYVVGNVPVPQVSSTGSVAIPNSNIQILDNKFEYWGGPGAITSLNDGSWQIKNNHFYNTFSTEPLVDNGSTGGFRAIYLNGNSGGGHTIEGNFIGGKAPNAAGAKMEMRGHLVQLIYVNGNSAATKTIIQNNTIANINATTTASGQSVAFRAIHTAGSQIVDLLNNTIGSASTANSLVMNKNTTSTASYYLIQVDNTGSSASNISNNTLANLQLNEVGGVTNANFYGIYSNLGTGNKIIDNNTINKISTAGRIGAIGLISTSQLAEITNNKIGSQSTTDDIMINSTVVFNSYGITSTGDFASKIKDNQIGGISIKATFPASASATFFGINSSGSTTRSNFKIVQNNAIGGTIANSIQSVQGGGAGQASVQLCGIFNNGGDITNNTVRNITANEFGPMYGIQEGGTGALSYISYNKIEQLTVNGQSSNSVLYGFNVSSTAVSSILQGNIISGLKSSNSVALSGGEIRNVAGILHIGIGRIDGNQVFNLEATGAAPTMVVGIATRSTDVIKNRIYDLKSSNATAGAFITGISMHSSTATVRVASNNLVHINYSGDVPVYGLFSEIPLSGSDGAAQVNMFYNTILLEGTASGSANSSAIYRTNASPLELKNNLLFNNRSGGSSIHSLYGTSNTAPAWVSDYNFLATASGNTNVGNWNGTAQDFIAWKAAQTGQDVNSINDLSLTPSTFFEMNPAFSNFLRTVGLGKSKVAEKGITVSVADDIFYNTRAGAPSIGAFEEVLISPLQGGIVYKINGTDGGNGPSRTFATLRSASVFANTYGLTGTGQAVLEFTAPYSNETIGATSITFNALPNASATLGLTIRPATGMTVTLSASLTGLPIIDLNDADYITFDGRAGGAGTASAFIVQNTSTNAATSVIRLINDAQYNKLSYLTIKTAAAVNITSGAVLLSTTTGTMGNTNNLIADNTFSMPTTGYSVGSTQPCQILSVGTAGLPNNNISILNNHFTHWGGRGAVYSSSGNNWQINNNHFYSTISVKGSGTSTSGGIILDGTSAHTISGNFFGGQAANAGGSKMTLDAFNWTFILVNGNSTAAKTTIQNNTIANIDAGTPATASAVTFMGIYAQGNQIFDVLNNTIGSTSVANSLVMNKNAPAGSSYYLIQANNSGDNASNISHNTIANLQYNETANTGTNIFYGIVNTGGAGSKIIDNNTISKLSATGRIGNFSLIFALQLVDITNNKIGSQSAVDDIILTSNTNSSSRYGIYAVGDFASKVTGNEIGGITIRTILATPANSSFFGVYVNGSTTGANLKTVENNLIGGTVGNSLQSVVGGGAGQATISLYGMANYNAYNRGNTIRNITANEYGFLHGISVQGNVGGIVENNIIEQLTVTSAGTSSYVAGIHTTTASTIPLVDNTVSGLKGNDITAYVLGTSVFGNWNVIGIFAGGATTYSGNKIYNLEATGAGATSVVGIAAKEGSTVLKNRIYDIKNSSGITGARSAGIALMSGAAGTLTAANNVVNVNHNGVVITYGVLAEYIGNTTDPASQVNAYYNTILLDGTASGSANSSAIYRTSASPLELKNNLFFNNRSGGSGIHSLYGTSNTAPAWVSDYNFLATASGNTNVGDWNGTVQNFAAWKAGHSGQDVNSLNDLTLTPGTFFDMASASNNFLKTTTIGKLKVGNKATTVAVTDDILGTLRAATPTIGAFEEVVVLPVTFNTFAAKLSGSKVNLNWSVSSESEIIRYEVERSVDDTAFVKVATVGAGQLSGYTAVDASPKLGVNYYRLSAINADGTAVYFHDIREVKVASLNEGTALVYPNPLLGNIINVGMAAYSLGNYTYKLSDVTGKLLQKGSFEHKGGSNTIMVNAAMPKGVYVLQVSNGREQIQAKLIKP